MYLDAFPYTETFDPHAYVYDAKCVWCGAPKSVTVPAEQLFQYRRGAHVQDAFPNMDIDDREFLISGVCPECFSGAFGPEEEEESGRISDDYPVKDDWILIFHKPE